MTRYGLEEMEILMMIAGAEEPMLTALQVRRRWRYILGLAVAAQKGITLDASLPQVILDCDQYVERAERILNVIEEWLTEQSDHTLSDSR